MQCFFTNDKNGIVSHTQNQKMVLNKLQQPAFTNLECVTEVWLNFVLQMRILEYCVRTQIVVRRMVVMAKQNPFIKSQGGPLTKCYDYFSNKIF
jgi:hypothetical protein